MRYLLSIVFLCPCVLIDVGAPSQTCADDVLATVLTHRPPSLLNGQDVPGQWTLHPGDAVTTGAGTAYVLAKYVDTTMVGVLQQSQIGFQQGWIDLVKGGVTVDLVGGSKYLEQIETPLGIIRLDATTGQFDVRPPKSDAIGAETRDLRLAVSAMQAEWQWPRADAALMPLVSVLADAGDTMVLTIDAAARMVALSSDAGEATVKLGDEATLILPKLARVTMSYTATKQVFTLACTRGAMTIDRRGEQTPLALGETREIPVAISSGASRTFASRRSTAAPTPVAVASVTPAASPTTTSAPAPVPTTAAITPIPLPTLAKLPDAHPYQRTLRNYLASLTEADVAPSAADPVVSPPSADPEEMYRTWLLTLDSAPQVGRKRAQASIRAPGKLFLLSEIERDGVVRRPASWPEPLAWITEWDYPGNPYRGNETLKRRAFVTTAVLLMALDHTQENDPQVGAARLDGIAHHLALHGYTFLRVRSVVPQAVQEAYLTGLKKIVDRALTWGPEKDSIGMELAAAVGLHLAAEALDDDGVRLAAHDFARRLVTDREFFHPAGYFVSYGGYDAGYNGQARYFANWLALLTKDAALEDALAKAYRLRAHLSLPEPDGKVFGPSHFNPLLSREPWFDQYEWRYRDAAGAMITDEAVCSIRIPTSDELRAGGEKRIAELKAQVNENPGRRPADQLQILPWTFKPWPNSWSFPNALNYAQDSYRPGSYARLAKLVAEDSPLLKLPFARGENFVRTFEKAFTITRQPSYGAVLHTGPIGAPLLGGRRYPGPYGFGGGQLSAFWTPETGSVILGRRSGMSGEVSYDLFDQWRKWPIHAVSGTRPDGSFFTSAFLRDPEVEEQITGLEGTVRVRGMLPQSYEGTKVLEGRVAYERTFEIAGKAGDERLAVETHLRAEGQDKFVELIETIPVFVRDLQSQRKTPGTEVEFEIGGKWQPAATEYQANVTAARLSRFAGKVVVRFDRPRRVKLAAELWIDTYLSKVACRNIMIDLLDSDDHPVVFHSAAVRYEIAAERGSTKSTAGQGG